MLIEEEYKFCHRLIVENIHIIEKTETYAVGAVAATMAFSATQSGRLIVILSSWLPLVISALGAIRFWGVDVTIGRINAYLKTIEADNSKLNWTTYYSMSKPRALKWSRRAFWVILIVVSFAFASVTLFNGPYVVTPAAFAPSTAPATVAGKM